MQATQKSWFYGGFVLLECVLWGIGNPVTKIGASLIPPFTCLALRFLLAFALFAVFAGKRVLTGLRRGRLWPCLAVCVCTALSFGLSTFSVVLTTATNAGFLMSLSVLFTPVLSTVFLGQRFNSRSLLPVALVTAGLYFLCASPAGFAFGWGEALALASSAALACTLVLSANYLGDIDPMAMSAAQAGFTGAACLVLALVFEGPPQLSQISAAGWGAVVYLAAGCTCAAYLLQNLALCKIPANTVSLLLCTEPIFTAAAAALLLGETLSGRGWLGAGMVLASLVLASGMQLREGRGRM